MRDELTTDSGARPEQADRATVSPRDIRLAAMDLLARREHLGEELRNKLRKRFPGAASIDEALRQLREEGLQSDERFCESYVRQRSGRGYGPLRIRMELSSKGAPQELVALAMESLDVDWVELAGAARDKKFGESKPADYREKARQSRFLHYRGFSGEVISRVIDDPGE